VYAELLKEAAVKLAYRLGRFVRARAKDMQVCRSAMDNQEN
jgi:hypothetical protein